MRWLWRGLVLVAGACALGALARSELILLVPLLVVPLGVSTRHQSWRTRVRWLGASILAAAIVLAPWTIYNTTRFVHPILLSAQVDPLLASANCHSTYYGDFQGYFDIQCAVKIAHRHGLTVHLRSEEKPAVDARLLYARLGQLWQRAGC